MDSIFYVLFGEPLYVKDVNTKRAHDLEKHKLNL